MSDVPKGTKCCELKYNSTHFRRMPCGRNAKVMRDGKPYCGYCDPVRVAEKDKAREEKYARYREEYDRRYAEEKAARERAAACVAAMQGIEDPAQFVADAMLLAEWIAPGETARTMTDDKRKKLMDAARRILAAQKSET